MQEFKITSKYIGLKNGEMETDLNGLKDLLRDEILSIIQNNFNHNDNEDLKEIKKWEELTNKINDMSVNYIINNLYYLDYIVEIIKE